MLDRHKHLFAEYKHHENKSGDVELLDFKERYPLKNLKSENNSTHNAPVNLEKKSNPYSTALYYLADFVEEELIALEKHYHFRRDQLEALIAQHKKRYWLDYSKYLCSIGTNIPWIYFNIMTGKAGIQGFAKIINPDATVSDSTANNIGASLSCTGTMSFVFYSSPGKNAALSTLAYATSDSLYNQIAHALNTVKTDPKKAIKNSTETVLHNALISTTYVTAGMSEIIPFMSTFNKMPAPLKWGTIGGIHYLSYQYMSTFMTKSYYEGVAFWKNKENRESLLHKIKKGEIIIPLQVFFQGIISSVGLRAFPNYYYIAEASSKAFGGYLNPIIVAAIVAVHGLCALYPATYNHYLSADEKTDALLKNSVDWDSVNQRFINHIKQLNLANLNQVEMKALREWIVNTILQTQLPQLNDKTREKLSNETIHQHIQKQLTQFNLKDLSKNEQHLFQTLIADSIIEAEKMLLKNSVQKEIGCLGLFKQEPWCALTVGWQGAIGAYFGSQFFTPLLASNPAFAVTILSGAAGASLFAGFAHRAETNRVINNLVLKQLETNRQNQEQAAKRAIEEKQTCSDTTAQALAAGFVSAYAASSTISTIGSNSLLGTPSPLLNTFIASAATQSGLNSINYMYKDVSKTLSTTINSISAFFKKTVSRKSNNLQPEPGTAISLTSVSHKNI